MKQPISLLLAFAVVPLLGGCHYGDDFDGQTHRSSVYVGRAYHHDDGEYSDHGHYDHHDHDYAPRHHAPHHYDNGDDGDY